MKTYVQSRGKPQDKDYTWLKARKNRLYREIPPILKRIPVAKLIDSRKYSIVLAQDDGELVLLITGLMSERSDFMNRQIRNSVAWVGDNPSEDEPLIRSLAVLALTDKPKLEKQVNEAVVEAEPDSEYEFSFNQQTINQIAELISVQRNKNAKEDNYIGSDSPELQQQVGLELEANCLPNRNGILVLLTSLKTESGLKEYRVWRGLSAKVTYDQLKLVSSRSKQKLSQKKTLAVVMAVVMAVVIILIVIRFIFV